MPDPAMPGAPQVLGGQSEATIDQANIAMRSMPWYQAQIKAWGQDPGHPHLSKSQSQQLLRAAQANGFVVDEGHMEMDAGGNFDNKGHALRNTLIVVGIAAATVATMGAAGVFAGAAGAGAGAAGAGTTAATLAGIEGGAAGLGAAGVGALGTGAMGATALGGLGAAGAAGAGSAGLLAGSATVPTAAGTVAGGTGLGAGASTAGGASVASQLGNYAKNYALGGGGGGGATNQAIGVGGQLISSYLQNRAAGNAADQNQAYLEQALAYQKEQDAYNRTRQEGLDKDTKEQNAFDRTRTTGLDQQNVDRYGYQTGIDAAKYGDSQQEYLANFAKDENRYAYSTDLEASRYGDYSKRIAPYLQSGASANDRMASLLGLPKGAAFDPSLTAGPTRKVSAPPVLSDPGSGFGGYGGGTSTPGTGEAFDPEFIGKQLDDIYAQHGVSATGPGTGPTDKQYFIDAIRKNKGWDAAYWAPRLAQELKQAGVGK